MAHLQYMPGDPRLVDQLVYELKSKGIFDQFRKECIADVDTRPAYQNLRQRVESSVSTFLSHQVWKPDLNKNQLREKLRKHILDGNYLEQGVERIVDQVVNPKVATVFIPQVEDLIYNYLGIPRKKTSKVEVTEKTEDLLPTDLEAVSPGSVKSNDAENHEPENIVEDMEIDSQSKSESADMKEENQDIIVEVSSDSASIDKSTIPLPSEEIKLENIPAPDNSPTETKVELENIELPQEPNLSTDIPLPEEVHKDEQIHIVKPITSHSENSNSSSGSSLRRNMSPITPVRNFDDENSCDAQQAFENNSVEEVKIQTEPSSFRFNIEDKDATNGGSSDVKEKQYEQNLSFQFTKQVKIDTYNTPLYEDSSNSHNLQIDYESDANSKTNQEIKMEVENSEDSKKERKDDKRSIHKSSHKSRDSSRHSSSKDGKHSSSKESSRYDKKSSSKDSKDDKPKPNRDKDRSKEGEKNRDSSKHRSSHKGSSSSKDKHRNSSSSHRHSSKSSEDKKSSIKEKDKSSEKHKERKSDGKDKDRKDSKERERKDSKSSSHRSDKDRKSTNSKKSDDKDKKKEKKDTDDHYSSSGRGNHSRRSTDRDSNDGSSSSKGSQNQSNSKSADSKKESKSSSSKSDNTSTSGESVSPSDKEHVVDNKMMQFKPIVRVDNHLEMPIANPPRLPFVPDVTLKKPRFANNFEEAKRMMKMRKFLAEEQKRMNQEAALLLEFQANVRPSLSQVYSSIPGPELEFACLTHERDNITDTGKNRPEASGEIEEIGAADEASILEETETKMFDSENISLEDVVNANKHYNSKNITKEIINEIIGVTKVHTEHIENIHATETAQIIIEQNIDIHNDSYDENKPFSQLMDEISKCGKASDKSQDSKESEETFRKFEVTVTAEALSESEETSGAVQIKENIPTFSENELKYFAEHEKFSAELERHKFSKFLSEYMDTNNVTNKMYLINCGTYEENIIKEMASNLDDIEVVNYFRNGHLSSYKTVVKHVPLSEEISLPLDSNIHNEKSVMFSPVKSECSFELSSDYDANLSEIVNKKSRQEVMQIILGDVIDTSLNKMPTIDYYTEFEDTPNNLVIDEDAERKVFDDTINAERYTKVVEEMDKTETIKLTEETGRALKRKANEEKANNNRSVLTPNKIRKISDSDQITSTTEEAEISNNNKIDPATRSKYLGRARRVGLPRPKRCSLPNSPSSDKSVENYAQNTPTHTHNGKLKSTARAKIQRYDTSDLYKPKLHYLSRRNNVS